MQLIKVTAGGFLVPDAIGAIESSCERFDGTGTMVCKTTVRSKTGGVLFQREDSVKLSDSAACEAMKTRHTGIVQAIESF